VASILTTGGDQDPFLPRILEAIRHADQIEFAVAFIKSSGLQLIFEALIDAVTIRSASLTLLTSDYMDVTDPQALRQLMLLSERGADIRMFESRGTQSFHLKAYIFLQERDSNLCEGTAFIGSSNISKSAFTDGIEWNYQLKAFAGESEQNWREFEEVRRQYQNLLDHPSVVPLDYRWIAEYERRRVIHPFPPEPGSSDPELPAPEPNALQVEALHALRNTREEGYRRGLVVMATGLGKTYLAAFDSLQLDAKRVLFVAHREEILLQAERTFQKVHPNVSIGRYTGTQKDGGADFLFASIQTLGKSLHLDRFPPEHFDYLVVDEFHHAAAPTYRRLLSHFQPRFLLGITATPDRTDQSDILSLCDDNLVFTRDLFAGVEQGSLCPFHYYGIFDESVDYQEIPWRNGRFDPESLSHKLATLARARHALTQWRDKGQARTLAFCVSKRHARFMADRFQKEGVEAKAVYDGSDMDRSEALAQLEEGRIQVIFAVDLFNEGVDLPAIDTVMMLRPTESKVLFIQQLGRGLRKHPGKEHLVVLDFIGNHRGFLNKPQALFGVTGRNRELADFAERVKQGRLELPPGCYVNYDLEIIDFLAGLAGQGPANDYRTLRDSLGRRPTLTEFYRSGASIKSLRNQYGQWWELVKEQGDLEESEMKCLDAYGAFLQEVETTAMTKSFKAVLLEAMLESDGFVHPNTLEDLANRSLDVFRRRRRFIMDIKEELRDLDHLDEKKWLSYWRANPINAWIGGNRGKSARSWFEVADGYFKPLFSLETAVSDAFHAMVQELVDYRFAVYEPRLEKLNVNENNIVSVERGREGQGTELPYFPDLRIACGHFREGRADIDEYRRVGPGYGRLDPSRHFIARAVGNSMNGGKNPIHDGDYLLLERLDSGHAGSITGSAMVIERQDVTGDDQYLLRVVTKDRDGRYILKATNPSYPDYEADESMRTLARLKAVIDPLAMAVGQEFMREEIPELFGETFNPGNWHSGHVVLNDQKAHVLLVTLNKQGKSIEHRYRDYFIDDCHFHWQSQNATTPQSKRGRELIDHRRLAIEVHLFVRENKLSGGKAAPFKYYGPVDYEKHEGSAPMSVIWRLCGK